MAGLLSKLESSEPEQIPKTVIFCQTKNNVRKVYKCLKSAAKNKLSVEMYHPLMTKNSKALVQNELAQKFLIESVNSYSGIRNGNL